MAFPAEVLGARLHHHLPPQMSNWTEDMLHRHFRLEKVPIQHPQHGQVLVKMERVPINPADLLIMSKQYAREINEKPLPMTVGYEGCGTVIAQGGGFDQLVGKRVAILTLGSWAEYCLADGKYCLPLSDDVSWEDGASVFINPMTAVGMVTLAKDRGQNAIIFTAAASALGKMVIKYGKSQGVNILCVVRKDQQVQECKSAGATDVFNLTDKDFDDQLKRAAKQQNASLAFECVSGELTGRVLATMPYGSEIKVFGNLSLEKVGGINFSDLVFENKKVSGYFLTDHMKDKSFADFVFSQIPQLLKGDLGTQYAKTYPLEEIERAVLENAHHTSGGKSLINCSTTRRT